MFHWSSINLYVASTGKCRLLTSSKTPVNIHIAAWKVSKYGVFSGPYFPAFGLNTERYGVPLRIKSKCGKIRFRKNSAFGHFSRSVFLVLRLWTRYWDFEKVKLLGIIFKVDLIFIFTCICFKKSKYQSTTLLQECAILLPQNYEK